MSKTYKAKIGEQEIELTPEALSQLNIIPTEENQYHILHESKSYHAKIETQGDKQFEISLNDNKYQVALSDEYDQLISKMGLTITNSSKVTDIKAPMPGLVLSVEVEVGQEVNKGEALLILEAMKMENVIKSPGEGKVKSITVEKGKAVEKGAILIEFE
ncbi:MAG: biotin/lipoyl-containing protein [Bacteroidota bacterium]